jgi:hypothetical protein
MNNRISHVRPSAQYSVLRAVLLAIGSGRLFTSQRTNIIKVIAAKLGTIAYVELQAKLGSI